MGKIQCSLPVNNRGADKMKKCNDCNCNMIENCSISGKHPFEVGIDERVDISLNIPTGEMKTFLGMPYEVVNRYALKARVCPKCGKIEIYTDFVQQS